MAATVKTLSALLQKVTIDDHEEILKACNAALKTSRNDPELLHIRVAALLQLDRHEDAIQTLKDHSVILNERTKFERAYALYKVGSLDEAKALAHDCTGNRGAIHVEAQAVRLSNNCKSPLINPVVSF